MYIVLTSIHFIKELFIREIQVKNGNHTPCITKLLRYLSQLILVQIKILNIQSFTYLSHLYLFVFIFNVYIKCMLSVVGG